MGTLDRRTDCSTYGDERVQKAFRLPAAKSRWLRPTVRGPHVGRRGAAWIPQRRIVAAHSQVPPVGTGRRAAIEFPDEPRAVRFEKYLKSGSGRAFAKRHFG